MRASFELKLYANSLVEAKVAAEALVAKFLEIDPEQLKTVVDMELKVRTYELKDDQPEPDGDFEVIVYGHLKNSILKPL
jgi:hypothetical protein